MASPGPLVLKGLPDGAGAKRQVCLSSGGPLPHQASWPWREGWWKTAGSHAHWHLEAQVQPRALAGFSQALLWQAQAWGVDSPDSLSRRLNLSLSGWNGWSGCLGQVLTPDAWTGAQSSRHLLQKTPLTHISQWSEAVRRRPKEAHHRSISHGGYHTGTAGLKPEKPSLATTNVQCPGVVHPPPSPISHPPMRGTPTPPWGSEWKEHEEDALGRGGRHRLGRKESLETGPCLWSFRPRPWPLLSIASPDLKQWESLGTYPSKEKGFIFFFHQCCSPGHSTMLIAELSWSDGIERQMKEAEEMSSNLIFVSGVSRTTACPPTPFF